MTESVFETVEKSCQVLKLDFSSAECKFRTLSHICTDFQPRCHGDLATPSRSKATPVPEISHNGQRGRLAPLSCFLGVVPAGDNLSGLLGVALIVEPPTVFGVQ